MVEGEWRQKSAPDFSVNLMRRNGDLGSSRGVQVSAGHCKQDWHQHFDW